MTSPSDSAADSRRLWVITEDASLFDEFAQAADTLDGWTVSGPHSLDDVLAVPAGKGLVVVDDRLEGGGALTACRKLSLAGAPRTILATAEVDDTVEPIARFCGAVGVLARGFDPAELGELAATVERFSGRAEQPLDDADPSLPKSLLEELTGEVSQGARLIEALADPETSLFNYEFLTYKLDEEYKRARRFGQPLSCVMLGFDGEADQSVLSTLASIFLQAARDTDILGRFDISSFLFLLPNTPARGAETMARRIRESAERLSLTDVMGDRLDLSVGIATFPHADLRRADDLFRLSREAFQRAQAEGVGVSLSS